MKKTLLLACALLALFLNACAPPAEAPAEPDWAAMPWDSLVQRAQGSQVTLMMWQGDPLINAYIRDFAAPALRERYQIDLQAVSGQGNQIVNLLLAEADAGSASSQIDACWINGETFFQLRQIGALYGPFVRSLPNSQYVDWDNPFIAYDFQQPVEGYECPWGNVQLALIYNSEQVPEPPATLEALEAWVKAHPGKFTVGSDFTGMTLLKSWLIALAGGPEALRGPFREELYQQHSEALWAYLNRLKPYLWNRGESFPASVAQMHQLFAAGELWFTMSNNDAEVDNKRLQGIFPAHARAYVPATGTIQNSHYLGIVKRAGNKPGALVALNFLLSPEAQWRKLDPGVWGDGTVLAPGKLPAEWQARFDSVPGRLHAPRRADIQPHALMEPAPEYMMRLFEDFKRHVVQGQ